MKYLLLLTILLVGCSPIYVCDKMPAEFKGNMEIMMIKYPEHNYICKPEGRK